MLAAPVLVGAWPRPTWWHLVLAVTVVVAFLALYADGLWLKSGRKARYARPALVYTVLAVVLAGVLVVAHPRLLAWAWVYLPGIGLSLWASARREDRSWWNDVVLVFLSGAATMVSAGLRAGGPADAAGGSVASGSVASGSAVSDSVGSWLAWPPPGADAPDAQVAAIVLAVYFLGTVAHVKAHIRDRNNPAVQRANVGYHAVGLLAALVTLVLLDGVWAGVALVAASVLLVVRSWLIPRRWPGVTPKQLGIVEIVLTVVVSVVAIALGSAVV